MNLDNHEWLEPELLGAGRAISRLPRPLPPVGLVERTIAGAAKFKALRKPFLFLRPITHPLARISAAAILMTLALTVPLTDLDTVDTLGRRVEYSVLGTKTVDRLEQVMDGILARINSEGYSQNELDALTGYHLNANANKMKQIKPRMHSGV